MIERSLMRPRGLLDLLRFCRSHAVNLGHGRIEREDIDEGEEAYSSELLNNIAYELGDVFPKARDVLYEFIESEPELSEEHVHELLSRSIGDEAGRKAFDLLLWYGFLGVLRDEEAVTYIYDVKYDIRRLTGLVKRREGKAIFRINPAFWKALEVRQR